MVLFLNELPAVDHRVQAVLRRLLEDGEHCHHQIKPQEHKGLHPTSNLILYNAVPRSANTIAVAGLFAAKARALSLAVGSDQWVRISRGIRYFLERCVLDSVGQLFGYATTQASDCKQAKRSFP